MGLQNPLLPLGIFVVVTIAGPVLVLRHRAGLLHPGHRRQPLNMARAQGINTDFNKVLGLMISNGLVALVRRACWPSTRAAPTVDMGRGAIVIGLAAVIIGEVIFGKVFHNFAPQALCRRSGRHHLLHRHPAGRLRLGLDTNDLKLLTALVVAVFLAIPYWKGKYFRARVKPAGSASEGGNGNA